MTSAACYYPLNNQLEVSRAGRDGRVNIYWKHNNLPWETPIAISPERFALPEGDMATIFYPMDSQLEVFTVGNDGDVKVIWKKNNLPWDNPPVAISRPNFAPPGAGITSVFYPMDNRLEVFTVGNDGDVKVIWKKNNLPWDNPPVAISRPNFAPPGANITSTYYPMDNQLEVFTVGNDGRVYVMWKQNNLGWRGPTPISLPNFAPPGAGITSVFYPMDNRLEVFTVGNDGDVKVIWKKNNLPWDNPPVAISRPNFAPPGANITSTYYPMDNQLEVFTVGNDGRVYVMWKQNNLGWRGPTPISLPNFAPPGAGITSVFYPMDNRLEVFTVGNDGRLYVIWKVENNWWVPCPVPPEPLVPASASSQVLRTVRVGQLTGSVDPQGWTLLNGDTRNWGVSGTDLGANTEHNDRLYFFFGDVWRDRDDGPKPNTDLVAWTDAMQVATHGGHAAGDFNFVLPHDQTPVQGQRDWRFCAKCGSLFFNGYVDKGVCSMGGGHAAAGFNFVLPHDQTPVQGQRDWRFCVKCNALFYDGYADNKGVCPKDGIGHEPEANNFVLPHDDTQVPGQQDWRFCVKCNALFYDGYSDFKGACSIREGGGFHLHPVMNGQYFDPFTVEGPIGVLLEDQTPVGAFSYGGRVYVFIWINGRDNVRPAGSYLVSKGDPGQPGPYREEFLLTPYNETQKGLDQVAPWVVRNADHPGLPNVQGDGVILFGWRHMPNAVYLAWMSLRGSGPPRREEVLYYTGEPGNLWASNQDRAVELFRFPTTTTYTSISTAWLEGPRRFIMLYSRAYPERPPVASLFVAPIVARIGTTPWNWSDEIELFNPCRERAYGKYMHWPGLDDIDIRMGGSDAPGWGYGAFLLNRFTKWNAATHELDLYYLLSLANPYQVQVMHSKIHLP